MRSTAATPDAYIAELPEEKKAMMSELRKVIRKNLPAGFEERMNCGMISYVVPHSIYPQGYHCDPKQPLPFMSIAAQKNYIALYHMALYAHTGLLHWFQQEYGKQCSSKLDMGKSCIRFKSADQMPLKLIGELTARVQPKEWLMMYESQIKKNKEARS